MSSSRTATRTSCWSRSHGSITLHPEFLTLTPLASVSKDRYLMTVGNVFSPPMTHLRTSVWLPFTLNLPFALYLRTVSRRSLAIPTHGAPSRAWSWTYTSLGSPFGSSTCITRSRRTLPVSARVSALSSTCRALSHSYPPSLRVTSTPTAASGPSRQSGPHPGPR
jgi:hypothetical protein